MTPLQLELTRLIGKKDLLFGCIVESVNTGGIRRLCDYSGLSKTEDGTYNYWVITEAASYIEMQKCSIIGHPATLSDLHRWMNDKSIFWGQGKNGIEYYLRDDTGVQIRINSSKDLLDQSEETLKEIVDFIKSNS